MKLLRERRGYMYYKHLKKAGLFLLGGLTVFSLTACQAISSRKAQEATTETRKVRQSNPDYVQPDVVLPQDFGNMIYPMEALMVEDYSKGLPYYTGEDSEEQSASFWFSMAVLTSQMNHYVKDVAVETDDRYIYIDEDTTNMYASSMYDAYGRGELEFPERKDDETYVTYNTDKGIYGFRQGTIGDLEPYVTDCADRGDEYTFTVHLKRKDSVEIVSSYEITIVPTAYESEENAFAYSVKEFNVLEKPDLEDFTRSEEDTEEADETTTEAQEDTSQDADQGTGQSGTSAEAAISTDEALSMAKDYYGDDVEYTYKQTVTIGDLDYYDFEASGEDAGSTDVLVSVDGENVMGGSQNEDGSWTFDQ